MSAVNRLHWKRALHRLRFCHEEYEMVKEIVRTGGGAFQQYYEEFCRRHDIDLQKLNDDNREHIQKLYGRTEVAPNGSHDDEPHIDDPEHAAIVPHAPSPDPTTDATTALQISQDERDVHEAFSKLFKKIALILHPDKIDKKMPPEERQRMISMFQSANRAMKEKKYFTLLDIAEQLNIKTPRNYRQQTRWMKREIGNLEEAIGEQKLKYNFLFAEAESEAEKDRVIRQFIYQVFKLKIPQNS